MNGDPELRQVPDHESPSIPQPLHDPKQLSREWLQRLIACNPFYLLSVALLLFGCYRISIEPALFNHEAAHLFFNFTSLQMYELLLVATAIFLARKQIWYDATLLTGLENLLVLVPFILISQAALIDQSITWWLCLLGGLLALVRLASLKGCIGKLNLPRGTLISCVLILILNAVLPALYRHLHESKFGTKPDWGPAFNTNQWVWWLVLPIVCGIAFCSARVQTRGELWPQRRCLPLAFVSLWTLATVVHLYCLDYVYDFSLRGDLVAPLCWILVWVGCMRLYRLSEHWPVGKQGLLFCAPVVVSCLAFAQPGQKVFFVLMLLNIFLYRIICAVRRNDALFRELLLVAAAALVAGFPEDWAAPCVSGFSRAGSVLVGIGAYVFLRSILSRDPRLALLAASVSGLIVLTLMSKNPQAPHFAIQAGAVFLLLHSLRWIDTKHPGAAALRFIGAIVWVVHSFVWLRSGGPAWMTYVVAAIVLGTYALGRFVWKRRDAPIVPIAAALVLLAAPTDAGARHAHSIPIGVLVIAGSFILFGIGTVAALTRSRWQKPRPNASGEP